MSEHDEWVQVAMSEDKVVVDMLLKLKQAFDQPLLRLHWSVRQPRSKALSKNNTRASSPTTPLSWSANTTSASAGPDAFEDSTPPPPPPPLLLPRSQVAVASNTPTIKRSRKKKTLAVLREEESLLQNEGINLREQLRTLRRNIEKQRAENSGLKKLKLDLLSRQTVETLPSINCEEAKLNQPQQRMEASNSSSLVLSTIVACNKLDSSLAISPGTPSHQLPDLNIPAKEDDSCCSFLYGLSC